VLPFAFQELLVKEPSEAEILPPGQDVTNEYAPPEDVEASPPPPKKNSRFFSFF